MNLVQRYRELLNRNHKVLNIHHKDLDGVASSIVMKNVFNNIDFKELRYGEVNEYLKTINYDNYDVVVLTDISPESIDAFDYSDKLFLLDHHDSAIGYHSPEQFRIVESGKCAAYLVKTFFENLFSIDLSYLNDFVDYTNDYDMWINEKVQGWVLNELYFKYWDELFRRRFKSGAIILTTEEKLYIKERRILLEQKYEHLQTYDLEDINGCFFFSNNFINDLCHKLLTIKKYDVVICVNPKSKNCSIRIKDFDNIHIGNILKEIELGGGHKCSAGFVINEYDDVEEKIYKIEKELYSFKELRRKG